MPTTESTTPEPADRPLPSATGPLATEARPPRPGVARLLQIVVSVCLALSLGFLVASNYLGWTARTDVTKVARSCAATTCPQKVVVEGRGQAFQISGKVRVTPGDTAAIRVKCTPSCQFE
ncbi:MAG TPA: hypothetical protein VI197_07050, partial [Polyangiaceae bacterium]